MNHDVSQCCRRESDQPGDDDSPIDETREMQGNNYQWTAPSLLAQYLTLKMKAHKPIVWSIDDYDGMGPGKKRNKSRQKDTNKMQKQV